ncbi:hypothetical protein [Frankia sp. Cj3]|uniref:hypothetical protein n=1 Tax=Frankia sp. Cj3 TaxID=2880976 RepID=UPI001EF4D7FF|nr:hypothetical protein [Frankia sp. Cj3]
MTRRPSQKFGTGRERNVKDFTYVDISERGENWTGGECCLNNLAVFTRFLTVFRLLEI